MRVMTDETIGRYAAAAASLPGDTVRDAIRLTEAMAAHPDDASDALPYAVIALAAAADTGTVLPVRTACGVALRGAERDRLRRTTTTAPTDWDAVAADPLTQHRVPVAPALITPPESPRWESVRERITPAHRTMLDGIAARGLARLTAERAARAATLPVPSSVPATDVDGWRRESIAAAVDAPVPLTRRALRVGDVAAAIGAPTPRSREASTALRAAACVAWSDAAQHLVSAVVTPRTGEHRRLGAPGEQRLTVRTAESMEARAVRAMAYVATDAAALSARYRAERDLVAGAADHKGTTTADTLRRLGWVAPVADTVSGSLTRSMPEPKKGAARRSRKGLVTPSTSGRYGGGVGESTAHGATVSGTRTGATDARRAAVASRALERDERAAAAHAARAATLEWLRPCSRPLPAPAATTAAGWWVCGCGATPGALTDVWPTDPTHPVTYAHPLTVCPVPLVSDTGARCGCGRKRGALVSVNGAHAHRPRGA